MAAITSGKRGGKVKSNELSSSPEVALVESMLKAPIAGGVTECPHCEHRWVYDPKKATLGPPVGAPRQCPRCRKQLRFKTRPVVCLRCGHKWKTSKDRPKCCPGCGSNCWDKGAKPKRVVCCLRCGHKWKTRLDRPKRCAGCSSIYWDRKRRLRRRR